MRNPRMLLGLLFVVGSLVYYQFGTTEYKNDFTGRVQRLALPTAEEEVAMGLASRTPLLRQFGDFMRKLRAVLGNVADAHVFLLGL